MKIQLALAKDHGFAFHGTSYRNAAAIIETDKLQLSQVAGKEAEAHFAKHPFFLSVRRNRQLTATNFYDVTIEFKEQALQSRMQRESVDYWGHVEGKGNSIEQEDRYYYAKPILKNAVKLIRALHINLNNYDPARIGSAMRKMIVTAKKLGIQVYLYRDEKAYNRVDKRKTVPLSEMEYGPKAANIFRERTAEEAEREAEDQMFKGMRYKRAQYPEIKFVVDILHSGTAPENKEAKYQTERFGYRLSGHELASQLGNILHNASHSPHGKEKQWAARVQEWMRKNGKNVEETAYHIREIIQQRDGR